ncbi:YeeE/YedE family protein [Myxococcota bacterium]|nr:YeeE/YedE family protein [Myxococcota bacterium]MBU1429079.1 YeeE/YedE family protein [Myxococcota bacterium]MBU1899867.1 YeeE/YedE family protein [Myxococcota bacterium]
MIPEFGGSQWGYIVTLLIGFGFGFVLEKAGFGRATKLAAQFYLRDMTVLKVMFTAIVTAMVGAVLVDQIGLIDLRRLSEGAVTETFIWPALIGGFALGMGFIISGYCPGTSMVATSSGHIDGLMTVLGVVLGALLYTEGAEAMASFHTSGAKGFVFLYDSGIPAPVLAALIVAMAFGAFILAEKVEAMMRARAANPEPEPAPAQRHTSRMALGTILSMGILALGTLALPGGAPKAKQGDPAVVSPIGLDAFSHRLMEQPWTMRVLDLRPREACAKQRVPGAECAPLEALKDLGLGAAPAGGPALVLIGEGALEAAPEAARVYKGEVHLLEGGWAGWAGYALKAPEPLTAEASPQAREAYAWRATLNSAMTGRKAAPPPAAPTKKFTPKKKKKGGGCG